MPVPLERLGWTVPPVLATASPALASDAAVGASLGALPMTVIGLCLAGTAVGAIVSGRRASAALRQAEARASASETQVQAQAQALEALLLDRSDGAAIWSGQELQVVIGVAEPLGLLERPTPLAAAGTLAAPAFAKRIADAMTALLESGTPFELAVNAPGGGARRLVGRTLGGRAVLSILEGIGDGRALTADEARLRRADKLQAELSESFFHAPLIAWRRDLSGRLTWVNQAYIEAVNRTDLAEVLDAQTELVFGSKSHLLAELAERARTTGRVASIRESTVIGDETQKLDFREVPVIDGTLGFAVDRTAQVTAVEALKREMEANELVLDSLRRGVALFTKDLTLSYFNETLARLWGLESRFLQSNPGLRDILNALREASMVPETRNFGSWRTEMVDRFRKLNEGYDDHWHLPNGKVLRLVAEPHPLGGLVLMIDDVSEVFEMRREVRSVSMVQNAALSKLREGVLVLGLDGRRRLSNTAFDALWNLDGDSLGDSHIREIAALCEPLFDDHGVWSRMIEFVSGATEARGTWYESLERSDGSVVAMAGTVLPNGATMFGFTDITDSVNKERVLREQNEKLEELSGLKSAFLDGIHGASNELKIPLNTIIGFSEILGQEYFGALNDRQREYIQGVATAAADLRTIVSNITDLAMIQADDFPFRLEMIDLKPVIEATVRFIERSVSVPIQLRVDCPDDIGRVPGDAPRFREILHNLINGVRGDVGKDAAIEIGVRREGEVLRLWIGVEEGLLSGSTWSLLEESLHGVDAPPLHRDGLSLTLARQFVERQGGTVALERGIGGTREAIVCRFLTDETTVRTAIERQRPRKPEFQLPKGWEEIDSATGA